MVSFRNHITGQTHVRADVRVEIGGAKRAPFSQGILVHLPSSYSSGLSSLEEGEHRYMGSQMGIVPFEELPKTEALSSSIVDFSCGPMHTVM